MIIHTMAEGISLARKLENDSADFYTAAARDYPQLSETLLAFARENKKNITQTEQTYYGVITDAIEGCFALDLETGDYTPDLAHRSAQDSAAFIEQALRIEETIRQFYLAAGEQSKLMADVSRNFILTAKKHKNRIAQREGLKV